MKLLKNLYQYRELLKSNVKKEIRGKYKGSFLGVLWSFVNPLLQVLVYAIVFPYIMRVKTDNYLVYKRDKKLYIVDYDGNELNSIEGSKIKLYNDYLIVDNNLYKIVIK